MNSLQDDYLLALRQESARSLAYYQFGEKQPTSVETIEFHLLHHCLTNADGHDAHLALHGSSAEPAFLAWLLNTIVLAKFHQNWIDSQVQTAVRVRAGDMLFHKDTLLCCAEVLGEGKWTVREAFKKNAAAYSSPIKKAIVLLRKDEYAYQSRKTAEQLISYRDYFRQVLNEPKLDVLSQFSHKTLLIADYDLLVDQPAYPVRYRSRNGSIRAHGLPIDTMIDACGTIETALTYILTGDTYFDEVIVVGSERYKKSGLLDNLRNEKNLGRYGKLILIGDEQPNLGNQPLKRWRWVASELKRLEKKPKPVHELQKLSTPDLQVLVSTLQQQLTDLREQHKIDAFELLTFLRFYYRLFLPDGPRRDAIVNDFHNWLQLYLRSDELLAKFAVSGEYDSDKVAIRLNPIWESLIEIRDYFLTNNPKYAAYLAAGSGIAPRLKVVVLASGRYADAVEIRERETLLTFAKKGPYTHLSAWARSSANNRHDRLYYVPGWLGTNGLLQLRHMTGCVIFYLFDGVETDDFTQDWARMKQYEQRWQQHPDRRYWFTAQPARPEPQPGSDHQPRPDVPGNLSDDMPDLDLTDSERLYSALADKAPKYRLTFTDGTVEEFYSYKSVWLLKSGQKLPVTVGELYAEASIQYYQNASPTTFHQLIRQLAGPDQSRRIDEHSQYWRDYCRQLLNHYNNDLEQFYGNLRTNGMTSQINRLRDYLHATSTIRFPHIRTLKALFKLGTAIGLTDHAFIINFKAIMASRRWDRNLRHSTGRQISDELMLFTQTGQKGELFDKLTDEVVYTLLQSIQEKTIASITLTTNGNA
ncbi:hypothetical protein DYU11_09220 [Fibrisoma montanum]|uniref:Uncharacterized protein n=1 Tax=Fibrisoma montanum TaxID=2305895 RepID=A0A418MFE1_9BACT|nr:hypothetical protein [Fibrisoma montanum]RIV25467.1 hypothetical protein DYU11_09220 [Fibrisoma montanum]